MIENLVASYAARPDDAPKLFEVVDIEVAHSPRQNLSRLPKDLESRYRFLQRIGSAPIQEIAIQPVRVKPIERSLTCGDGAPRGRIFGQHLRNQEYLLAAAFDCSGNDLLRCACSVHFGRVDVRHSAIEPAAQSGDRLCSVTSIDIPGSLPDHWDLAFNWSKLMMFHRCSLILARHLLNCGQERMQIAGPVVT
jgi:hypothetical protein